MARGITETDIWQAADALLLEGQRPTIERVRGKIGRGSPNTVAPHLETWFRHLGGRIQDPGAFSAPPDLPDPIQQAAQHFWAVALSHAREDGAAQIAAAIAEADARVSAAGELQQQAERDAKHLQERLQELATELDQRARAVEAERTQHAQTRERLAALQSQLELLQERLTSQEHDRQTERDQLRRDVQQADERAEAAERRAALEIDRERQLRARSDRQAEQLTGQMEVLRASHQNELLGHVERTARLAAEVQARRDQCGQQETQLATVQRQLQHAVQDAARETAWRQQAETQSAALQREFTTWRQTHGSTRPLRKSLRKPEPGTR